MAMDLQNAAATDAFDNALRTVLHAIEESRRRLETVGSINNC